MIRILLANDHKVVRTGVKQILSTINNCEVCGEAENGQEALEKTAQLKPDLVLMDISMPKVNGLEATKLIRQVRPVTKIIILSMHDSPQIANEARVAGADAYLTKTSVSGQLESVITDVCNL